MSAPPAAPLALQLAREARTLVLATHAEGPWAAPVYFFHQNGQFHFLSSPRSRHIQEGLTAGSAAAAIFRDGVGWQEIEGLQMEGTLAETEDPETQHTVFRAYVAKFPLVRDFFPDGSLTLHKLLDHFRSRLYAFSPTAIHYLNNRLGFGRRQPIDLRDWKEWEQKDS